MTGERGFSLIEVVVVLGVMSLLVGTAAPLVGAMHDGATQREVTIELNRLAAALEAHFYDHARFPRSLRDRGFLGTYLYAGVDDTAVLDGWSGSPEYGFTVSKNGSQATLTSTGPDGQSRTSDDVRVAVSGSAPGNRRTRERMTLVAAALAQHLHAGETLQRSWSKDRKTLGLGEALARDGFGRLFRWDKGSYSLRSAGADGRFGTGDDLTW